MHRRSLFLVVHHAFALSRVIGFGHGFLGQMASTAWVVEEPPIRGERPDETRCGRNDDLEAGVADGHRPCRGAWVEPTVCSRGSSEVTARAG